MSTKRTEKADGAAPAGGQKKAPRQRTWEDVVAEGIKDGTVVKSAPTDERDRKKGKTKEHPEGNTVELIVENFHGIKRATGIGPTHAKAREALVEELKRATGTGGPVLPESGQIVDQETAQAVDRAEKGE